MGETKLRGQHKRPREVWSAVPEVLKSYQGIPIHMNRHVGSENLAFTAMLLIFKFKGTTFVLMFIIYMFLCSRVYIFRLDLS